MLSGLSAQHFTFHGYLPKEEGPLSAKIKQLQAQPSTHLFIETPYRNTKLFNALLLHLRPETWLCVAADLTLPTQWVMTLPVSAWKKQGAPAIDKRPAVFVMRSNP